MRILTPGSIVRGSGIRPAGSFRLNLASPQAHGLVSWIPLTDFVTSGKTVSDHSLYGRDLSITGSLVGVNDEVLLHGVQSDSTSEFFATPSPSGLITTAYTWHLVVNGANAPQSGNGYAQWYANGSGHFGFNWHHNTASNEADMFHFNSGGGYERTGKLTTTLTANTWWWITGVWNGADLRCYVNGQLDKTSSAVTSIAVLANTPGELWHVVGVNHTMRTAEFRLYTRALSPEEVWQLYDPATRWDLYLPVRVIIPVAVGSGGAQTITASAIASEEAFGSDTVQAVIGPSGIASLEAFGAAKLMLVVSPSGLATEEALGLASVGSVLAPSGIGSTEAFGTLALPFTLLMTGLSSAEQLGTSTLRLVLVLSSIGSEEVFGAAQLNLILLSSGIASSEQFGAGLLRSLLIPASISSDEAFGAAVLNQAGGALQLMPSSIGSAEAFGLTQLNQYLLPSAISSGESIGDAALRLHLATSGIPSSAVVGTPQQLRMLLYPEGVLSGEAFGMTSVMVPQSLLLTGLASDEAFGGAQVVLVSVQFPIKVVEASGRVFVVDARNRNFMCTAKEV